MNLTTADIAIIAGLIAAIMPILIFARQLRKDNLRAHQSELDATLANSKSVQEAALALIQPYRDELKALQERYIRDTAAMEEKHTRELKLAEDRYNQACKETEEVNRKLDEVSRELNISRQKQKDMQIQLDGAFSQLATRTGRVGQLEQQLSEHLEEIAVLRQDLDTANQKIDALTQTKRPRPKGG